MAVWLITQGCDVHKLDVSGASPFQEAVLQNLPQVLIQKFFCVTIKFRNRNSCGTVCDLGLPRFSIDSY